MSRKPSFLTRMAQKNSNRKRLPVNLLRGVALLIFLGSVVVLLLGPEACGQRTKLERFEPAEVVSVSDGDTIQVKLAGEKHTVRLIGVDAPESVHPDATRNTPEGQAAADFVNSLLRPGQKVWLVKDVSETDQYGRLLRYVWLEIPRDALNVSEVRAKMLNAIIVDAGHAQVKKYPPDVAYHNILLRIEKTADANSNWRHRVQVA